MRADGCKQRDCEWPKDKALDLQPVQVDTDDNWGWFDCFWNNYQAVPTRRGYNLCPAHLLDTVLVMTSNVQEEEWITRYYSGKVRT